MGDTAKYCTLDVVEKILVMGWIADAKIMMIVYYALEII